MKFRDILSARRKELNLTQSDIAKACDVSEATVSRWESGAINTVKFSKISPLARILQISPSTIIGDTGDGCFEPASVPFIEVPLYSEISCGSGIFPDDRIRERIPLPLRGLSPSSDYFCLIAKGDSMTGAGIAEGDLLVFEKTPVISDNQIGCFLLDSGEAACKRFLSRNNTFLLQPANPEYDTAVFENGEPPVCLGVLKKIVKDV